MYGDYYQRKMFEMLKDYGERLIHYSEDVLSGSSTNAASRKWNIYTSDVKKIAELAAVKYEEPELIEQIKERRFMTWEEHFVADLFDTEDIYVVENFTDVFDYVLGTIDERKREILVRYYKKKNTLQDIGESLGLSRERIRQIKSDALETIRYTYRANYFRRDFWYDEQKVLGRIKERSEKIVWIKKMNAFLTMLDSCDVFANPSNVPEQVKNNLMDMGIYTMEEVYRLDVNDIVKRLNIYIENKELFTTHINSMLPVAVINGNLEEAGLSVRTYNCLKRHGVNTIEEMCRLTSEELMQVRRLGRKGAEEVLQKKSEYTVTKNVDDTISLLEISERTKSLLLEKGYKDYKKFELNNPHKAVEMRVAIGDVAYAEIYNYLSLNGLIG